MRRLLSVSNGWLCKALATAGPPSYSSPCSVLQQLQHGRFARPKALRLQLYSTISYESADAAHGSVDKEVDSVLAVECGAVPLCQAEALLELYTHGNGRLPIEVIKHITASACFNDAATLRRCTPSELSR